MTEMENEEEHIIHVSIAGRPYVYKVLPSRESAIRNAVDQINERVASVVSTYKSKDQQDGLCVALLEFLVNGNKEQADHKKSESETEESLETLNNQLEEYLKKRYNEH